MALPIIILQRTGSAYHAATVFGVSFIPWVLFSLIGGSLADNYPKKKILILGNISAVFASVFLIGVLSFSRIDFKLLYFSVFILASVDPLIHPSFQSIIPEIVRKEQFARANAVIQTIDNTLSIMGPLAGGTIVMLLAVGILRLLPNKIENERSKHIIRKWHGAYISELFCYFIFVTFFVNVSIGKR